MKQNKIKIISFLVLILFFGAGVVPVIAHLDMQQSVLNAQQHLLKTNDTSISNVLECYDNFAVNHEWTLARSLEKPLDSSQAVLNRDIGQNGETLRLQYTIPEPKFSETTWQVYNYQNTKQISLGNTLLSTEPGKPEIPIIPSRVILPKGQRIDRVDIIIDESAILPERYLLSYAQQPHPITCTLGEESVTAPDTSIYESNDPYPSNLFVLHETQYAMGVAIAHIDISPVIYKPLSGCLEYFSTFTLEVVTVEDENFGSDVRVDINRFKEKIAPFVENPDALHTYTDGEILASNHNVIDRTQSYSYVFITSEAVANDNSVNPSVSDFITHRQAEGYTTTVMTTDYIYANYPGSTNSDKLRNFIKDAYNNWDTQFVTLGGDTNIIPLKTVYSSFAGYSDNIPTDLPYQCLDGDTWNNDFFAEVMIGRISGQTATQISNQMHKIIQYETYQGLMDYLQTGLSVGEELDSQTYGKLAMLELETYFSDDWEWEGLFDFDGTWQKQAIINHINSDSFSVINHLGHSNYNYVMKMYNGDENSFTNTNYIFVKSQGCIPGAFDQDCITERFTTQQKIGGLFAAVMNSRYGWYTPGNPYGGPSHQLHKSFWYAAWDLEMDYFSEYNEYSHRQHYVQYQWDVLQSNYFGCAATPFRGKEIPGDPPTVTVTRPIGGEVFTYGTTEEITWSATGGDDPINYITLLYSANSGSTWKLIETGLSNTGIYSWTVPNENSNNCLVKVRAVDVGGRVGEDISSNMFTIIGAPPAPPMNLVVDYVSAPALVIFDDFSDGSLDDWTIFSGSWSASNGYLEGSGSISTPSEFDGYPIDAYGRWEYDIQMNSAQTNQHMRLHFIQINNADTRYSSGYYIIITGRNSWWDPTGQINLWRWDNGNTPSNSVVSCEWNPDTNQHTLAIERDDNGVFRIYMDDNLVGTGTDTTYTTNEYLGFRHTQDHKVHEIRVEVIGEDDDHNLLIWNASPDDPTGWIDCYTIYRSEYNTGPWDASTMIDSVNADGSNIYNFIDIGKGMADDIIWWYVVRAVGVNGLEEMNTNAVQEPYGSQTHMLTVSSTDGGEVVVPGEGTFSFIYGSTVYLIASANQGYAFVQWSGDIDTIDDITNPETTIEILDDYTITAEFTYNNPDLDCDGSLSWSQVKPGNTVNGTFTVSNIGEAGSLLDWAIQSYPSWGTWTFTPNGSVGLSPEDGAMTVSVSVIAPDNPETEFSGQITIINSDDPSDTCVIDVALATPFVQQSPFIVILQRLIQQFPMLGRLRSLFA
ncbi:MAG: C25 family cysteine peptidase [Thermoplasmatota archaeon]